MHSPEFAAMCVSASKAATTAAQLRAHAFVVTSGLPIRVTPELEFIIPKSAASDEPLRVRVVVTVFGASGVFALYRHEDTFVTNAEGETALNLIETHVNGLVLGVIAGWKACAGVKS